MAIRQTFARMCRETRIRLDITQAELASAVHVSRGYIPNVETGRANPSIDMVDRIARVLGLQLELEAHSPTFLSERRPADFVHARCSAYVGRRLRSAGWQIAREVPARDGRIVAWIDLLTFDPHTGRLLIIEVKTRLDESVRPNARSVGTGALRHGRPGSLGGSRRRSAPGSSPWRAMRWIGRYCPIETSSAAGCPAMRSTCSPSLDPPPRPWRGRSRWSIREAAVATG